MKFAIWKQYFVIIVRAGAAWSGDGTLEVALLPTRIVKHFFLTLLRRDERRHHAAHELDLILVHRMPHMRVEAHGHIRSQSS